MAKKKRWQQRDPDFDAESRKYAIPVPSRKLLLATLEDYDAPMSFAALSEALELRGQKEKEGVGVRLAAMERAGQVIRNRREEYCLVGRIPIVTGRVSGHRDGYGFVIPDEGDSDDVYLSPRQMRELMHKDRVAVRIRGFDRRGRPEGSLVEVLERNTSEVAGRYVTESGLGFVVPDNTRIAHRVIVPPKGKGGARDGQMVVAEILEQPTSHAEPIGRVKEVLGAPDAAGIETEMAIRSHGLRHEWPDAVEAETERFGPRVATTAKRDREDLRELPLVTIDGADARDFDDAVYCEATRTGWRLIVAIADVSHYVSRGSAIDSEAQLRGTSVYFPSRVIPMLPEVLSNGLCSLNPKVDRLCMVCEMRVSKTGDVTRARFYEGVMRSAARLTYTEVADAVVEKKAKAVKRIGALMPRLEALNDLYKALAKARRRRGAVDFDTPEPRMRFDEEGRIADVYLYRRNDAHKIIEECMIAANVQAARFLVRHRMPTLFRRHDPPAPDRIDALRGFLGTLGLKLAGARGIEPHHLRAVVEAAAKKPESALVSTVVLRSMSMAIYHPESHGHFGLALEEYAHFTSPIRRYPDLLVHRAIRHVLRGGKARDFSYDDKAMEQLGRECSDAERRADEATREAVDWLECEFMQHKLGEEFQGYVSGVTDFGLFVTLDTIPVDGLVHVSSLGHDYFTHEREAHRLSGRRSGQSYRLGDKLRVKVVRVDLESRKIDFELLGVKRETQAPVRRRRRRR